MTTQPDRPACEAVVRELEDTVRTDFGSTMSYANYLDLPRLLSAQHPHGRPELVPVSREIHESTFSSLGVYERTEVGT